MYKYPKSAGPLMDQVSIKPHQALGDNPLQPKVPPPRVAQGVSSPGGVGILIGSGSTPTNNTHLQSAHPTTTTRPGYIWIADCNLYVEKNRILRLDIVTDPVSGYACTKITITLRPGDIASPILFVGHRISATDAMNYTFRLQAELSTP